MRVLVSGRAERVGFVPPSQPSRSALERDLRLLPHRRATRPDAASIARPIPHKLCAPAARLLLAVTRETAHAATGAWHSAPDLACSHLG
jgi:hypothetical protein